MFDSLVGAMAPAMALAGSSIEGDEASLLDGRKRLRANRQALIAVLEALRDEPSAARGAATRSYWHSNGFAKIVAHSDTPDLKLRLHVWPEAGDRTAAATAAYQNVHNHRWPLASIVLCGEVRVEEFRELSGEPEAGRATGTEGSYRRYRYDAGSPKLVGKLEPDGDCRLRRIRSDVLAAGDTHHCDRKTLHSVAPASERLTATFVAQGRAADVAALVYQRVDRDVIEDTGRAIDGDEVVSLASRVLDAVKNELTP